MIFEYGILFPVLVLASLFDLWQYKVPNALCGAALIISLITHWEEQSFYGLVLWFSGIIIPFILCYVLYCCRMLGAGDSKLLSVIGSFVGVSMLRRIMAGAIVVGAGMSVFKMLRYRNGKQRFLKLWRYIVKCMKNRRPEPYYDWQQEGDEGVIPFVIAISISTLWCLYSHQGGG